MRAGRGSLLFILQAERGYLLAATKRSITLQKTETENLFYIKNWGYYNKSS